MSEGLIDVKFLGFTRGGKHVWVQYLSGAKKGILCRKPASIMPSANEREWIEAQKVLGRTVDRAEYIKSHQYNG